MKIIRFIFFPFAIIYWLITGLRNGFYALGIFKSSRFSLPIINVGNLSVGGTGKTPHTEYLIRLLKDNYHLATLSRGFGRKERGFIIAEKGTSAHQIGDEPFQYFNKFGDEITVVVDANRVTGVMDLCRIKPETNLILLDDAYQHRAIQAGLNILITPYGSPFYSDFILPVGDLREARSGKKRADIVVVSKCPAFEKFDKDYIRKKINPTKEQAVFFSKVNYSKIYRMNTGEEVSSFQNEKLIVVTGIANADPFIQHLAQNNEIVHHFKFKDHHNFKHADLTEIHNLFGKFVNQNPVIVTTEKDAMRLLNPAFSAILKAFPWCYQTIAVELDEPEKFNKIVKNYVEKNS